MENPRQADTTLRSLISSVQLARGDVVAGTIFYKQLFSFGTWANPLWWWDGEPTMELTRDLAEKMIANFEANVLGSPVTVPLNHTDDVNANTGRVTKLEIGSDGLYGYLEIKDELTIQKINDGRIADVSVGFDWDYVSQKDSAHYGPVLFHVALVNTPYINDMSGFTEAELSKRNHEYAQPLSIGGKQGVIMMSKAKVEELKAMKFAKVTNDKEFPIEVTYKDGDQDTTVTIEPGQDIEVPSEVEADVKSTIETAVAPADDTTEETADEKAAREQKETEDANIAAGLNADGSAKEETPPAPTESEETLSKTEREQFNTMLARNAELEAEKQYSTLLASGHIVPAQKEIFMSLAVLKPVALSTEVKGLKLAKGAKEASIITMLSAILSAGPSRIKFGEKGKTDTEEGLTAELSKEDEAKIKKMGFSVEKFKAQLAKGTFTLKDLEGDK